MKSHMLICPLCCATKQAMLEMANPVTCDCPSMTKMKGIDPNMDILQKCSLVDRLLFFSKFEMTVPDKAVSKGRLNCELLLSELRQSEEELRPSIGLTSNSLDSPK